MQGCDLLDPFLSLERSGQHPGADHRSGTILEPGVLDEECRAVAHYGRRVSTQVQSAP